MRCSTADRRARVSWPSTKGGTFRRIKGSGLVTEVFDEAKLATLKGNTAIGHVRYTTAGGGGIENVQPFLFRHNTGDFALAHNGNIVNSALLRESSGEQGQPVPVHLRQRDPGPPDQEGDPLPRPAAHLFDHRCAEHAGGGVRVPDHDRQPHLRLPGQVRPASAGHRPAGRRLGRVERNLRVRRAGCRVRARRRAGRDRDDRQAGHPQPRLLDVQASARCARWSTSTSPARTATSTAATSTPTARSRDACSARSRPADADIVVGVPDSSLSAAMGYAEASGLPYEMGLIKNKYIGRTFIQPSQELREKGVRMKLSAVRSASSGASAWCWSTTRSCAAPLRGASSRCSRRPGATEVHVRIASPPMTDPCFYGVDTSTREELISARKNTSRAYCEEIGADSLVFLSPDVAVEGRAAARSFAWPASRAQYPTALYQSPEEANKDVKC